MTGLLVALIALVTSTQVDSSEVRVEAFTDNVWIHTSYTRFDNGRWVFTNGLIIRTPDGPVLVDTAWTDEQTATVLDWVEREIGEPVIAAILTHAHHDKMGGVGLLHERGVETHAHAIANRLAPERGLIPAMHGLELARGGNSTRFGLDIHYPGPGHTAGNIVVYDPVSLSLFGGCLIRPHGARTMGNTADGDVDNWDDAARSATATFPETRHVIPSHGAPRGPELLDHTIALALDAQSRE